MKKSKQCYDKGKGHRLSRDEYLQQKGYKSGIEEKKIKAAAPIKYETSISLPRSEWNHDGLHFTLWSYECRCGDNPTRMYVKSKSDIDWTTLNKKEEYDTITKEAVDEGHFNNAEDFNKYVKQLEINFACETCILREFNGGFHCDGNLNLHFIRNGDKWYHYEDAYWLKPGKCYPDYDNIKHEFTMTSKNYKRVLRSISSQLTKKRNFTFIHMPSHSMRLTGFCTLCEQPYWRNLYPVCSTDKCICTHRKEMHYYDHKWDALFVEYDKEMIEQRGRFRSIFQPDDDPLPTRCVDIMLDEDEKKKVIT